MSTNVVIIGGGLAGLTLARHLLLHTDKHVLVVDRNSTVPTDRQKVGESSVQVGGYYFSKVLDMEEHLWREHFMKYNLRFYWKSESRDNRNFEDYSQAFIRNFSNVPSYQLNRNRFEAELLSRNAMDPRFDFVGGIRGLDVELAKEASLHTVAFDTDEASTVVNANWVIDTTGRSRWLSRKLQSTQPDSINHGAAFLWVDGLVDIEKLTELSARERRLNPDRRHTGHLPFWTATNHFMGEGFWFWVIPLQGKTSLGIVYDNRIFPRERAASAEKMIAWVCREFPLFERDLPQRTVVDFGAMRSFSYGCDQTISPQRWAMSGMSGRFTDPLYSPGSDFIAIHNSLIVDAIQAKDRDLKRKCRFYEMLMQALNESLISGYSVSYDALGDQECFTMKYTWELSVYFSFFVFPFINDLTADTDFIPTYVGRFSRLGKVNRHLQHFISAYYQWKQLHPDAERPPIFQDFTELAPLARAEKTFYEVGVTVEEAREILNKQLTSLEEFARFLVAWVYSVVSEDPQLLNSRVLVDEIDFSCLDFNPETIAANRERWRQSAGEWKWSFCTSAMERFRNPTARRIEEPPVAAGASSR